MKREAELVLPALQLKLKSDAVTDTEAEDAPKGQALLGVRSQQNVPFGLIYDSPRLPVEKHMSIV